MTAHAGVGRPPQRPLPCTAGEGNFRSVGSKVLRIPNVLNLTHPLMPSPAVLLCAGSGPSPTRERKASAMSDTTPDGRSRPLSREEAQAWQLKTFAGRNPTAKETAVREAAARIEGECNG